MALDTRNKRASAIGAGLAFLVMLPAPDGTVAAADRIHATGLYAGIAAATTDTSYPPSRGRVVRLLRGRVRPLLRGRVRS